MRPIRLIQTGILLILAAGTPILAVWDEKFWFEKRVALAVAAVVLLGLLAARVWRIGRIGLIGPMNQGLGWGLLGAAMVVAACLPAGRVANLATPDLWAGLGAVAAYFVVKNTTSISRQIKLGFWAAVVGVVAATALSAVGIGRIGPIGPMSTELETTAEILKDSPIIGEFREFRVARLGILQVASGLGILGILGVLGLAYQLTLKSAKEIFKSGGLWQKVLNLLVLVLLTGFLVLPHPALTLWPLAVVAALAGGISQIGPIGPIGPMRGAAWAGLVGLLVVVVLGSGYGLWRGVAAEVKFREALRAANKNEGIATYYALLEAIKRNPYEVRYRLLASQIDLALANSIAASATLRVDEETLRVEGEEATTSAQLSIQDTNNIMILIQQAVIQGKRAVQLDPENSLLWQNLAAVYRGLIGVAGGAEDWALKCLERAAGLSPKDPNPPLRLGEIHFLSGNFQGAREAFEKAAELGPQIPLAHYDLAIAYNALGEVDRAIKSLERVLELLPEESPDRAQVEKDLEFLQGEIRPIGPIGPMEGEEATPSTELREATSSAEVEAPPPPVGPEEATESGKPEEQEIPEGLEE